MAYESWLLAFAAGTFGGDQHPDHRIVFGERYVSVALIRALRPRLPHVGLMRDDHVEFWQNGDVLSARAHSGVRALEGARRIRRVPHPPHIAVSPPASGSERAQFRRIHLVERRHQAGDSSRPLARYDLLAVPIPLPEHQQPDPRHIARRKPDVLGLVYRASGVAA